MANNCIQIKKENIQNLLNRYKYDLEIPKILGIDNEDFLYTDEDLSYDLVAASKALKLGDHAKLISMKLIHHDIDKGYLYFIYNIIITRYYNSIESWSLHKYADYSHLKDPIYKYEYSDIITSTIKMAIGNLGKFGITSMKAKIL